MGAVDILELSASYDLSIPHSKSSQGVIMLMIWSPSGTGNAAYNSRSFEHCLPAHHSSRCYDS